MALLSVLPTAAGADDAFSDVPADSTFHEDIAWAGDAGVASGYDDGTFGPTLDVTRQALASFLYQLAGQLDADLAAPPSPFPDVDPTHPFHDAIAWLAAHGIASGYADGEFHPEAVVSRQALAAMVERLASVLGGEEGFAPTDFADVGPEHLFHDQISWLATWRLADGYPDGTFRSTDPVTRQAAAAVLHRLASCISTVDLPRCALPPRPAGGYTMLFAHGTTTVDLIDDAGAVVHTWTFAVPGVFMPQLLPGGRLLRPVEGEPQFMSGLELYDWDGTLLWRYDNPRLHHDYTVLPDGNLVVISSVHHSPEEAVALGRDPATAGEGLEVLELLELDPSLVGDPVVGRWSLADHLVQERDPAAPNYGLLAEHPDRVDVDHVGGFQLGDLDHANSVDYSPELDQLVVSARNYSEVWVIDHAALSVAPVAGEASTGILYRWGDPQRYGRGSEADRMLFGQHDAQWLVDDETGAVHLLVFNNGYPRPPGYSSVDELVVPVDADGGYDLGPTDPYGPEGLVWTWVADPPESVFSPFVSGAQRLGNGNTLVMDALGMQLIEVAPTGEIVWLVPLDLEMWMFKTRRYLDLDGTLPEPVLLGTYAGT